MKKHEIVTIYNNCMRNQRLLDTGPPVGFEVDIDTLKRLNVRMLNILTDKDITICGNCEEPVDNLENMYCPKCGNEV